jgi:DNA-binding NarL/FixJ family response regulator
VFEPKKRKPFVDRAGTSPPIRILVVDDHGIVREALVMMIERHAGMTVVGSVADGADAVSAAVRLKPDLILMDLVLRDMNGTDATRHILALLPLTRIIVLSACHTTEHVCRALRAGARGYVLKEAVSAELLLAIPAVMSGEQFLSTGITPLLVQQMMSDSAPPSPMETLSARERQVLHRIVAGASSAEIAVHLCLSRKTVDTYRGRLMTKLGVGNRSALIRLAIEHERAGL